MRLRLADSIPGLVHFVQAALNTRAHTEQGEIEILLDMSRMWSDYSARQEAPDWAKIEAAASHHLSQCSSYAKVLATLAREIPAELIFELSAFQKAWACDEKCPNRFMGSEFISKLAGLNFGKFEKFPLVMVGAFKANLTSKGNKLVDGFCKLLQPSHIACLAAKDLRPKVKQAESVMANARTLCKQLAFDAAVVTKLVGRLDVRLILHLCKQEGRADGKTYTGIAEIEEVWGIGIT